MGERMNATLKLLVPMVLVSVIGLAGGVHAQKGDGASQQQEMDQMMEMLEKSGMDPEQVQQMQDMFKGMEEKDRKQSSAKLKNEQQNFEAETAEHGTAQVEVEGKRYELTMTECKITDRSTGHFSMSARQAPGMDNVTLEVSGGGGHSLNRIGLMFGKADFSVDTGSLTFQLNGKTLNWEGEVAMESRKKVPLKFNLTCGAEMVDYATPSQSNPDSSLNALTLHVGKEAHTFQAGHCSTKEYRTGNLIVQFEATATGTFRGRPAIVLLSKSHPVELTQTFQNMDLLLGELTPEQRILSPLIVAEQLRNKMGTFESKGIAAVQKKYEEKIAAWQKHFEKEMPALKKKYGQNVPQDKVEELMEPFNNLMEAQSTEMNEVQEQVKAMRYPAARSFGAITLKGQEVHFGGSKLRPQDAGRAPEFQDLPEKTELWVTCGE